MGIDRPDDRDAPQGCRELPDVVGQPEAVGDTATTVRETRDLAAYGAELRAAVASEHGDAAAAPAEDLAGVV